MQAFNVTTTAQVAVAAGRYDFISIQNVSDTVICAKYDGDSAALTTANGQQIAVGATLFLEDQNGAGFYDNGVSLIHGGSGSKEVRIQTKKRGN